MNTWLLSHQQILSHQYEQNTLPHAILISGVAGTGKLELAQWLLHLLTCQQPQLSHHLKENILQACGSCKSCLLLKSNTYPDHLNLVTEKNSLGVDDIRHANSFLQKTAHLGKFKTVLINHAQTMTTQAANALLKTLEEPSANSVILLLTHDIENLLPTIVSRCRVLNIRPKVGKSLLQGLSEGMSGEKLISNSDVKINTNFVNLTQLPELTDKVTNEAFQHFKVCYLNYLDGQRVETQLLQQLLNNQHALRWLEQITVDLQREKILGIMKITTAPTMMKTQLSSQVLHQIYKVIINGCKVIKSYTQANKQFVCEQLIMKISDVIEQTNINKQER